MSFYGDNINRFFFGTVVNNNDADLNLGRVQIRVSGLHGPEVMNYDLPWAQVLLPTTEPGTGGVGANPMIANGAQVFGVFLDGKDSQIPLVLGTVPKIDYPSVQQVTPSSACVPQPPAYVTAGPDDGFRNGSRVIPVGSLEGSTNGERVYRFFVNNGFTPEQACGWVGNFAVESFTTIDPTAFNSAGGGQGAFGIAQWRGVRQTALREWAGSTGQDYRTLEAQLGFVLHELETTERTAGTQVRSAGSAAAAARAVEAYYERSGGDKVAERVFYAEDALARYR